MPTSYLPAGYHTITPYLVMRDAGKALVFYQQAFGAIELVHMPGPEGKVMHAEIKIGDSVVMLADECPEMNARGPVTIGGTPVFLLLYVADVDAAVARAIELGATLSRPVQDQFYGDRSGMVTDPFGHSWCLATHMEDVTPEEMQRRMAAMSS